MPELSDDQRFMRVALDLAGQGQGLVEPNPMVGCVIVQDGKVVGEGFHEQFGGRHAEINALAEARDAAAGSTVYVSLEPCCHHGKTPPCTEALIEANVDRVVVATLDPSDKVSGTGIEQLRQAGIEVTVGVMESESKRLIAPFAKLAGKGVPWIIAKWAMTLDGKIATSTGDSQWISNADCRKIVHEIRGRVDAVMVGRGTAIADDPRLDARPAGVRTATRIVVDSAAQLSLESRLVQTATEIPVLVATGPAADSQKIAQLQQAGCEVLQFTGEAVAEGKSARLELLLRELGHRHFTNVLVEGGSDLLGSLFDLGQVDEVHVFIGNRIAGGEQKTAVSGAGIEKMADAWSLSDLEIKTVGENVYIKGYV